MGSRPKVIDAVLASVSRHPSFWLWNLIAWGVFAIFSLIVRTLYHQDLWRAAFFTLLCESVAILITFWLRRIYKRFELRFAVHTAAIVALISLAAAIAVAVLSHSAAELTGWHNPFFTQFENWLLRVLMMWAAFGGWSLGYFWIKAEVALRRANVAVYRAAHEARRMELQMLRAQLDPHFLFNSLNGIAAEISVRPETAAEMVCELSDYLRYSLDHRNQSIGDLSAEIDAMTAYLEIEKARFGEHLRFRVDATDEARGRCVPSFMLQPLVENAIKHGLNRGSVEIEILAEVVRGELRLNVINTGELESFRTGRQMGVGLEVLNRRLDLHYPHRHRFRLTQKTDKVYATLILRGEPCSV